MNCVMNLAVCVQTRFIYAPAPTDQNLRKLVNPKKVDQTGHT